MARVYCLQWQWNPGPVLWDVHLELSSLPAQQNASFCHIYPAGLWSVFHSALRVDCMKFSIDTYLPSIICMRISYCIYCRIHCSEGSLPMIVIWSLHEQELIKFSWGVRLRLHLSHVLKAQEKIFSEFNTCVVGQHVTFLCMQCWGWKSINASEIVSCNSRSAGLCSSCKRQVSRFISTQGASSSLFSKGLKRDIWWWEGALQKLVKDLWVTIADAQAFLHKQEVWKIFQPTTKCRFFMVFSLVLL